MSGQVAVLLSTVMAVAALGKLGHLDEIAETITRFESRLPLRRTLAIGLAAIELSLAALLLFSSTHGAAAIGLTGILAVFAYYLTRAAREKVDFDCRCFGIFSTPTPVSRWHVGRTLLLLAVAVGLLIADLARGFGGLDWSSDLPRGLALAGMAALISSGPNLLIWNIKPIVTDPTMQPLFTTKEIAQ